MKDTEFYKLAEVYGFAPSRALRELLDTVYKKAFHDANINAAATILDAAVLEEREACAYRAGIALFGADRGLANRVDQAIRARSKE